MVQLSARLLWCAKFLFACAVTHAYASPSSPAKLDLITVEQARTPDYVRHRLTERGTNDPYAETTRFFFEHGLTARNKGDWGNATRGFGEAMLRYPSPQALFSYAEAEIRRLGKLRAYEGTTAKEAKKDMAYNLGFYRSAAAADDVLKSLGAAERKSLAQQTKCLADFVEQAAVTATCEPVKQYLSGK